MYDLNRFAATGRLVADPDLRYTRDGTAMAKFTLAIARPGGKPSEGRSDGDAIFFPVVAWGRVAESASKYTKKGDRVAVDGTISESRWTDRESGEPRSRLEIIADRVVFLSKARKNVEESPDEV